MDKLVISNKLRTTVGVTGERHLEGNECGVRFSYKRLWAMKEADMLPDTLPAIQTVYDEESEIMRSVVWYQQLLNRDRVGETCMNIVGHFLDLTPSIQIALIKPRYWRPALIREAYLLERCGVDPEKVWRKMDDHTYREEITHSLNLLLALRRQGIHHEGFESALNTWLRKHK
ncbi:hypothetical protein G173_gp116 [Erwinia phage phiEaH2]|uniref:Uncharacterized protein n=1 Tax=Erwinia phage phiEaH2 TaxID=1029988 RepID=J7KCA9_9CAUD|nr:hypothetical protein G173_gp116 [Erwinia phage phiEaH2]AFQ96661.1 hypothetical protein [Erwinia phage phiEaH2]